MEIIVIGAGWFGCHIADALSHQHDIRVMEVKQDIFQGTSGHNQNRLHLGFHYPRSHQTRMCAKHGYAKFLKQYGHLCESIDENIYAIASKESLLDFETYLEIMDAAELQYDIVDPDDYGLKNVTGAIRCKEMLVRNDWAKEYFEKKLADKLIVGAEFSSDYIKKDVVYINCTSQMCMHNKEWNLIYEPCIMFNYKIEETRTQAAITVMDGPLCTIYPKGDGLYSLYSVNHSPLEELNHPCLVNLRYDMCDIEEKRDKFEKQVYQYLPYFHDVFKYCGYEWSLRVTMRDNTDRRVPEVIRVENMIHVLPSKIDNVFYAEQMVRKFL